MECRLKEILKGRGMSQTFLAKQLGVTNQAVYTWTVQTSYPSLLVAYKVANMLDVEVTDIWVSNKKEEK